MRHTRILSLLCTLAAVLGITSCWDDVTSETVFTNYNNALITSFNLKENSEVCRALSSYAFTIDHFGNSDTAFVNRYKGDMETIPGIIFNADSLPKGSTPDSIKFTLKYAAPDSVIIEQYDWEGVRKVRKQYNSDSAYWFTEYAQTRIIVLADDHITRKTYFLKINVHSVEGDTICWKYVTPLNGKDTNEAFDATDVIDQRVDTLGNELYWFREASDHQQYAMQCNLSSGLKQWSETQTIDTPEPIDLTTLFCWDNVLYAVGQNSGALMTSADAYHWTVACSDLEFVSILGLQLQSNWYEANLKAVVKTGADYAIYSSLDGKNWSVYQALLPEGFPIKGYTMPISVPAHPDKGNITSRIYITGGVTKEGQISNSSWSCDGTESGWVEFPHNEFPAMRGASVIQYTLDTEKPGSFWILHPGILADGSVSRTLWYSENCGISWQKLSRWFHKYSDNSMIEPVACANAFFNPKDYTIYFLGGTDSNGNQVSTMYSGSLPSLSFWKKK